MSGRLHAKSKAKPGFRKAAAPSRPSGRSTTSGRTGRAATGLAPKRSAAPKASTRSAAPARIRTTATKRVASAKPTTVANRPSSAKRLAPAKRLVSARVAGSGTKASSRPPVKRPTSSGSAVRSPQERAAGERRRNRVPVALAAAAAVVILATSFPLSVLLGQHGNLSAASAQMSELQHQNALLSQQRQALNSNAEVERLAQQNYQLVQPGRSLFVILPPAGQASTTPGAPTTGDPGDQPLVSPSHAPNMSPDPGLPQATAPVSGSQPTGPVSSALTSAVPPSSFWSRITSSLEFWK